MDGWNRQLKRIIWRSLGRDKVPSNEFNSLFQSISDAFDSHDKEYSLLNRIMDLSSEELFEANEQLRKRNEELDRFMYSASHDLRAPLTSIMGLLQLIELENDQEAKKRYLSLIKASTEQLDNFIQDLLTYTHNKKVSVEGELIDFDSLIDSCFQKLSFMNTSKGINREVISNLDVPFYSDKKRLDNLMSNLISNAIKYSDEKKASKVRIMIDGDNDNVNIEIADNGLGIKASHHDKIFDMFYRASSKSKGSGIGLYIVKEIVDKLDGEITMESEQGVGTTFKLKLPNMKKSEPVAI